MTTLESVEKLLKDYLDQLTQDELKTFQWRLLHSVRDGCRPIARSQLEKATREDTVDTLVQVYGEEDAVQTTVDILFRMNRNDLVLQLAQAIIGPAVEQQIVEPSSSAPNETHSTLLQDISCSVCLMIFTEPVVLLCGHSFCKTCVHNHWKGKIFRKCPLCKQVEHRSEPSINFHLRSLVENYKEGSQADPSGRHRNNPESCQTSRNVREKKEAFEKVKQLCDSSIECIKAQSCNTERKMKEDFEKLHRFLNEEEDARIVALKEEETQKIRMMQMIAEMNRNMLSLSDTVKDWEDLGANNSFIQNFRTEMERAQNALPDPQLLPQPLINVAQHVENLQFKVCEKMRSFIEHRLDYENGLELHYENRLDENELDENELDDNELDDNGLELDYENRVYENGLELDYENRVYENRVYENGLDDNGLELDYDNRTVSFHDADNNMSVLTYEESFTENLPPYFGVEINRDDADNDDDLYDDFYATFC